MYRNFTWSLFLAVSLFIQAEAQKPARSHRSKADTAEVSGPEWFPGFDDSPRGRNALRVMFYNVENLFDNLDDPGKNDEEYLPGGIRNWSDGRYWAKQNAIARVIAAVGGWELPEIVGLCEVENRKVLTDLVSRSALQRAGYDFIHEESPDMRGVDVALLYRPEKFRPFHHKTLRLRFPFDTAAKTRDILLVSGKILNQDTLHVFVNHWPSKFGGAKETEPRRLFAGQTLRKACDSLLKANPSAKILIMGDLNDEHFEPSLREGLRALPPEEVKKPSDLYSLGALIKEGGTHKFQQYWHLIDHFIVSGGLFRAASGFGIHPSGMHIFEAPFLLVRDENNLGFKPNRTFEGMRYNGGFADHLPIYLDLVNTSAP